MEVPGVAQPRKINRLHCVSCGILPHMSFCVLHADRGRRRSRASSIGCRGAAGARCPSRGCSTTPPGIPCWTRMISSTPCPFRSFASASAAATSTAPASMSIVRARGVGWHSCPRPRSSRTDGMRISPTCSCIIPRLVHACIDVLARDGPFRFVLALSRFSSPTTLPKART